MLGSQDTFVESYLTNQRSHVFTSVAVLIFVFDISSKETEADMINFALTIRALHDFSPTSKVFVLIHKMDLVPLDDKTHEFNAKALEIRSTCEGEGFAYEQVDFWATSIWDQSLYKAWTKVIYFLIPNSAAIANMLQSLADTLDAREVILYERTTCLVVTQITRDIEQSNPYTDRFERISSILKAHKHSMARHTGAMVSEVSFAEMHIKSGPFMFFISHLTDSTNLAVVLSSDRGAFDTARATIQRAKLEFAHLDIVEKKGKAARRSLREDNGLESDGRASENGESSSRGMAANR